jgi:hypothetical protein
MGVGTRRWLAFAGGCVMGIGIGGIASGAVGAANYYIHYPNITSATAAPAMWLASLLFGVGLGMAIAAAIRE